MQVTINGKFREITEGSSLAALLLELNVKRQGTAVEINREIVPRAEHTQRLIAEGDIIEIIRMVGGG